MRPSLPTGRTGAARSRSWLARGTERPTAHLGPPTRWRSRSSGRPRGCRGVKRGELFPPWVQCTKLSVYTSSIVFTSLQFWVPTWWDLKEMVANLTCGLKTSNSISKLAKSESDFQGQFETISTLPKHWMCWRRTYRIHPCGPFCVGSFLGEWKSSIRTLSQNIWWNLCKFSVTKQNRNWVHTWPL